MSKPVLSRVSRSSKRVQPKRLFTIVVELSVCTKSSIAPELSRGRIAPVPMLSNRLPFRSSRSLPYHLNIRRLCALRLTSVRPIRLWYVSERVVGER